MAKKTWKWTRVWFYYMREGNLLLPCQSSWLFSPPLHPHNKHGTSHTWFNNVKLTQWSYDNKDIANYHENEKEKIKPFIQFMKSCIVLFSHRGLRFITNNIAQYTILEFHVSFKSSTSKINETDQGPISRLHKKKKYRTCSSSGVEFEDRWHYKNELVGLAWNNRGKQLGRNSNPH